MGSILLIDKGNANQEYVFVNSITGNVINAQFQKGHSASAPYQTFSYNQARDATIPDGSSPAGISASAEYLFNTQLNSGAGGVEFARSAAGELDGASGTGTAIAAEYEFNGGGPIVSGNTLGGFFFDRARNLQGKGNFSTTIVTTIAAGSTSLNTSTTSNTITIGAQVRLDRGTVNEESAYVSSILGNTITFQAGLYFSHNSGNTVEWDIFSSNGPGLTGFTATGIGIEEEALYNPGDGKYYIERAATNDAASANNIVMENLNERFKVTDGRNFLLKNFKVKSLPHTK
jgi:hypothetical protein